MARTVRGGLPYDGEVQFACSIVDIRHIPMRLGPQTAKPPTSNHRAICLGFASQKKLAHVASPLESNMKTVDATARP